MTTVGSDHHYKLRC